MLAKARTVNGYENMSRQQLETIFTIPSIPKWTPKPTPWISIAIQQCQCKCGHMFWQLQHFGIVVPVVDTICFLCSHWYANSEHVLFPIKCFVITVVPYLHPFHLCSFILSNPALFMNLYCQRIFHSVACVRHAKATT